MRLFFGCFITLQLFGSSLQTKGKRRYTETSGQDAENEESQVPKKQKHSKKLIMNMKDRNLPQVVLTNSIPNRFEISFESHGCGLRFPVSAEERELILEFDERGELEKFLKSQNGIESGMCIHLPIPEIARTERVIAHVKQLGEKVAVSCSLAKKGRQNGLFAVYTSQKNPFVLCTDVGTIKECQTSHALDICQIALEYRNDFFLSVWESIL